MKCRHCVAARIQDVTNVAIDTNPDVIRVCKTNLINVPILREQENVPFSKNYALNQDERELTLRHSHPW